MWAAGEIKQGDSGLVVSNKLDSEFARIQQDEIAVWGEFANLVHADLITINDRAADRLIVNPWAMWSILDPMQVGMSSIEKVTDHLSEQFFDGIFWLRSDVMVEYVGSYITYSDLKPGNFLTKQHMLSYKSDVLDGEYLAVDGTIHLAAGYVPSSNQSIATKKYIDDEILDIKIDYAGDYLEFPAAAQSQVFFSAPLGTKKFSVFLNGVLQRRVKYGMATDGITFNSPLDAGDEVTIIILGV